MTPDGAVAHNLRARGKGVATLGALTAWALAFADLGSSIYYVPGILFSQVGGLATGFVLVTTVAFILVAFEHLEVAHRYPGGGGGIAAAVEAFGARMGVLSGALLVNAYFVAIALTVTTAMHYLATLFPAWPAGVPLFSVVAILALGVGHGIAVRTAARLTLVASLAAFASQLFLLAALVSRLPRESWTGLLRNMADLHELGGAQLASGFAAAWLSYSGLESLAQMAPALREPRRRVVRTATTLLVGSVLVTVPVLTGVAVQAAGPAGSTETLLAHVAYQMGGRSLQMVVVVTAALLLLLAAKVAFSGCFSVFQAIGEHGYLPAAIAQTKSSEKPPLGAVIVATVGALVLILSTDGDPHTLGQLFAFGLLGSYTLTSVSLDVLRWRERRWAAFGIGLMVSLALAIPWVTSWYTKWQAAVYGSVVGGALLVVALVTHRGWIRSGRFGFLRAALAEQSAAELDSAVEVLTLQEALDVKQTYSSTTLVALRAPNRSLCLEAARRARGVGDTAVYVVFVEELPGLIFPSRHGPSDEGRAVLRSAVHDLAEKKMDVVPIWRLAHDAGASLAEAAEELGVNCVFVGTSARGAVWNLLQGDVLKRLIAELPEHIRVIICH
jgi:amino acid transporter